MRNDDIRKVCGAKNRVNGRINKSILRWYGHRERMDG